MRGGQADYYYYYLWVRKKERKKKGSDFSMTEYVLARLAIIAP